MSQVTLNITYIQVTNNKRIKVNVLINRSSHAIKLLF